MIVPEFPAIDDRSGPKRLAPRTYVYLSAFVSVAAHFGVLSGCFCFGLFFRWLGYEPPQIRLHSQRAAIDLQASIEVAPAMSHQEATMSIEPAAGPKPDQVRPEFAEPIAKLVERRLPTTGSEMLPIRVETKIAAALRDPPPLDRAEPLSSSAGSTAKTVSLPKRKPAAAVAPVESVASNASVAVDCSEFDEPPEPHLDNRKPPYPPEALTRGIQGVVMLRLRINSSGNWKMRSS